MNLLKKFYVLAVLLLLLQAVNSQGIQIPLNLDYSSIQILPPYADVPPVPVTRTDFTITLSDGVQIDAVKFIPQTTPPAGGWPTVIMVHGYGENKETHAGSCQSQASNGYYAMTFSMRGQGNSTGLSNLISRTEAQDFIQIVNWVKGDAVHGSNPNKILVTGGSQGGLIPNMAACLGLNVKAVISSLAPPDFASNWIENGSIKMTFLWTVSYAASNARYTPQVDRMKTWVYANNKEKWDSLAYWVPKDRDFLNIMPNSQVPVIMLGSWQDKFFNGSGILKAAAVMNAPFRIYLGATQGHGGEPSTTESQWVSGFYYSWFSYWLLGIQNGVLNQAKYQYASTMHPIVNNYWTFKHDSSTVWPAANTTNLKLYFNPGRKLKYTSSASTGLKDTLINSVTGGLTLQQAVNYGFTGSTFNSKFTKKTLNFDTDPLPADYKMAGIPKVKMEYSSTAGPFAQYNYQIYEVKPDGSQKLVNRINYTDRNYTANTVKNVLAEGQAHSHIFKAGNKIRVTLTNLDTSPDDSWFMETNPFVLPVVTNSINYLHLTAGSYLELPIRNLPGYVTMGNNNTIAAEYKLEQNYPNPFNPSTTINYSIAAPGFVSLKVYDLSGKEVRTLVNEYTSSGSHMASFDASGLASGVYFYKLITDNFQDVKRMVLVK